MFDTRARPHGFQLEPTFQDHYSFYWSMPFPLNEVLRHAEERQENQKSKPSKR